jgi:hypothetical protein
MLESVTTKVFLASLSWDQAEYALNLFINGWVVLGLVLMGLLFVVARWIMGGFTLDVLEIDQAEIGIGENKLTLKPNLTDRQVAYAIWVELSTRKIGLKIDFEHDVIAEVYDSWHDFFSITRDLVKSIPVNQIKRDTTQKIIQLSIDVLNHGLRPHLTKWQARFRHWYEREIKKRDEAGSGVIDPQQIQETFPRYGELKSDMERINTILMKYRSSMFKLIREDKKKNKFLWPWSKKAPA